MKKASTLVDNFIAPPCYERIKILYQGSNLLVIDKPSGLLSLSGKKAENKDSVHARLIKNYPTATMVHRLDFGTSGLMVVALDKAVNAHLTKQFQARLVRKEYLAILLGHLPNDEGTIDVPLTKGEFPYQRVCFETGKQSLSHYQVLERLNGSNGIKTTKVLFTPLTGRTHQLRIHSRELGYPIIGCDLYGKIIDGIDSQQLANRLMLHANRLSFEHPVTGENVCFVAQNNEFE